MNEPNWIKIKSALLENFIDDDIKSHSFYNTMDFNNALEIFWYILNLRTSNHGETKAVIDGLQLYIDGNQDKDVLERLISKFEPFAKKLLDCAGVVYSNPTKAPALGWCMNTLFRKQPSTIPTNKINDFFATNIIGQAEQPSYNSDDFETQFLTDGTPYGKSLHKVYHLRNSSIHNDQSLKIRDVPNLISDCIISYLYFIAIYYNELVNNIPAANLVTVTVGEVRDLLSLSGGAFKPIIENEVQREGIIQTIDNKLEKVSVLFLEGTEGVGKTTILHQYAKKYSNNCFTYFIDSKDKNTYTPLPLLQALCNQLYFHFHKEEFLESNKLENYFDETFLKKYFHSVKLNNVGKYYFIIDGLDEINEENRLEIKEHILDLIPINRTNIKLILTGKISNLVSDKVDVEFWEIPSLSKTESKSILGSSVSYEQFSALNKVCQNNAGKLVFIRELVNNSHLSFDNIIQHISNNIDDLFIYLWNKFTDKKNDLQGLVLAIIAFEGKKYDSIKIAQILNNSERVIDEGVVKNIIDNIPFIRRNNRNTFEYIFEDLASFAKKKLFNFKRVIDEVLIAYLINNSDSKEALIDLPELYRENGKIDDLVKLLGETRWKQLLEQSESISDVSKVSTTALQAIKDIHENRYIPTILKYSVLKSALKELNLTSIWQYEIAANLALDDDLNALNLANIAFLKEDRLRLFASIAKTYSQKNRDIPIIISNTIQELFSEIDFKGMGDNAVNIASLLMYSNPKLAFKLIEELSGTVLDNENAFDWALAQISLFAYKDLKESEDVSKEDVNTKIYSKIRNPQIKEFTDAVIFLSENQTLNEIIQKIRELESTSQKLFLIRNWILNNKDNENVHQLIELGIDLVVNKSDEYVPKASDFKIFSEPLPYLQNGQEVENLINKIEQHLSSIESISGIREVLRIKLLIAQSICNFNFEKGENRLLEIYNSIVTVDDLALKSTCLAVYSSVANKIKVKFPEKEMEIYADSACDDVIASIDNILDQTAEHFEIVQGIIKHLVKVYPDAVLKICNKLNKAIDRENAYLEALATYLKQDISKLDFGVIDKFLDNIIDLDIRQIALYEIYRKIDDIADGETISEDFYKYFKFLEDSLDNEFKCSQYIVILSILEKAKKNTTDIYAKLVNDWKDLETSASKIDLGFEIAFKASFLQNKDISKQFLLLARQEKERPELLLDSPNTTEVYYLCIDLAIRLFSGLIVKNTYNEADLLKIETLISSLPSETQKIKLWSTLVLKIAPKADQSLTLGIINKHIIPKLSKIKNKSERVGIIMEITPVLYLSDINLKIIEELPSQKLKDIAISKVCNYLLTGCLPNDPCSDNEEGFPIDYERLKKILGLIPKLTNDYIISWQLDELRKSIISSKTRISGQQITEVRQQFNNIAEKKLPDYQNIKHNGYQILVKAYALSIYKQARINDWQKLLEEVEVINNLSDKIFMWISFASLIPNKSEYVRLRQELINKSSKLSYDLPSFVDTVGRISMILISLKSKKVEGINIKGLITDFVDIQSQKDSSPKLQSRYQHILDVAYSTDPAIAKVFLNVFDGDPARKNTGAFLNNHLNYLEFQNKIEQKINVTNGEQELLEQNPKYFFQIIDKKLAKLNGTKESGDNLFPKELLYQLDIAAQKSIDYSHNAFVYFIERLILKYENTSESERLIRKSFLELVEVCNLVKLLSIRNADKIKSLFDIISSENMSQEVNEKNILDELGEEIFGNAVKLLNRDFTPEEVASILNIDLNKIKIIYQFQTGVKTA